MRFKREPIFPWYPKDWKSDCHVQQMTLSERGAYRELLDALWLEGTLPLDHRKLARICSCELRQFKRIWKVIEPRFGVTADLDGIDFNERLTKLAEFIEKYSNNSSGEFDKTRSKNAILPRFAANCCIFSVRVERLRNARNAYRNRFRTHTKKEKSK